MNFHDIRFPEDISFGSSGGPERLTRIVTLNSGHEQRNTTWLHSRRRYDAGLAIRNVDKLQEVVAFFEARMGRLYGFRWKDWVDFKTSAQNEPINFTDQEIGLGDGSSSDFQLSKTYFSGNDRYTRPITKPVEGSVKIGVSGVELIEGTDYTLDFSTGLVTVFNPPALNVSVTAGFEFDVPVRFDTDFLEISASTFEAGQVPNVPIVEIRT